MNNSLLLHFRNDVLALYKVSYLWYTAIGAGTVIIIGLIVSFISGANDPSTMDPQLFTPAVRRFLPKKKEKDVNEKSEIPNIQM